MQGFPNKVPPSFGSVENVVFLGPLSPKPQPIEATRPKSKNLQYICDTPPKPVPLSLPEMIKTSMESPLSPFSRYTKKQNQSLLSVICSSTGHSPLPISPKCITPISSPTRIKNQSKEALETDEFGFFIEMSESLFSMNNAKASTQQSKEVQWKTTILEETSLEDIPQSLFHSGIPHSCRKNVWKFLATLHEKKKRIHSDDKFNDKLMNAEDDESMANMEYEHYKEQGKKNNPNERQIQLDLSRTFPTHCLYRKENSVGQMKLYNVLLAYSEYNKVIGYCQGMSYIAGLLLMIFNEAESFWLMEWILQSDRLGDSFSPSMSGIIENAETFDELLCTHYPLVYAVLKKSSIHPLMYITTWYMTLFTQLNSWAAVLQFFDLMFYYGPQEALFRYSLALIHICQEDIITQSSSVEGLLPYLQNIPVERCNNPLLVPLACSFPIQLFLADVKKKIAKQKATSTIKQTAMPKKATVPKKRAAPAPVEKQSSFFDKMINSFSNTPKESQKKLQPVQNRKKTPARTSKRSRTESGLPTQVPFPANILQSPAKVQKRSRNDMREINIENDENASFLMS